MVRAVWRMKIELLPFGERASSQISDLRQLLADLTSKHRDRPKEPTPPPLDQLFVGRTACPLQVSIAQRRQRFESDVRRSGGGWTQYFTTLTHPQAPAGNSDVQVKLWEEYQESQPGK